MMSANALGLVSWSISLCSDRLTLPNYKTLDWSKLKAFEDDKINGTDKFQLILERIENIVGKGENAGYQHFLLFSQCFLKASYTRPLKVGIV